jgi:hypothetical protein
MHRKMLLTLGIVTLTAGVLDAQTYQRRATMTGNANSNEGKCTIEVVVDGAAEVTIQGDYATLRNLSGQPPQWRRFECNRVLSSNPVEFRFRGIDGRGEQGLVRSAQGGGAAVVRIEDPAAGAEGYTFDIMWTGGSTFGSNDPYRNDPYPHRNDPYRNDPYSAGPVNNDPRYDNYGTDDQRACEDAIQRQASRRFNVDANDIRIVQFDPIMAGNRRGNQQARQNERYQGRFEVFRGGFGQSEVYRYNCRVNDRNGRVQAQILGRDTTWTNDRMGSSDRYGQTGSSDRFGSPSSNTNAYAFQSCERAVEDRLRRDGYQNVTFGSTTNYDTRASRNDVVVGTARADARYAGENFDFSCSMSVDGSVRSVDVRRR